MSGNSALLAQIQQGRKLKKAETNDRSAPIVEGAVKSGGGSVSRGGGGAPSAPVGGAPQLGGLFAGGMPKLKPSGQGPAAKAPALGKPPSIPKRGGNGPTAPAPPATPSRSAPPLPPTREAPARVVPAPPSAPAPPRRPPPPARPVSPPPRPASTGAPSTPSRQVPPPPARPSPTQSPALPARKVPPPPTTAGRAPPPPPPRPSSIARTSAAPSAPSQPARAVPPPPTRRVVQQTSEDSAPPRVRAASTGGLDNAPALPGPSPARSSLAPPRPPPGPPPVGMRGASPGRRAVSVSNVNGAGIPNGARSLNGARASTASRIPSPPPSSGPHTFPSSSDFPPPRAFTRRAKKYASGNVRGSSFNVSALA